MPKDEHVARPFAVAAAWNGGGLNIRCRTYARASAARASI